MRGAMLMVVLLSGLSLHAALDGVIIGTVVDSKQEPLTGVEIKAEVDNQWAHATEEAAKAFRERFNVPTLEGSAAATSDNASGFKIAIKVSTAGEGKLPKAPVSVNGGIEWYEYAAVTLTFTKPGYRAVSQSGRAYRGFEGETLVVSLPLAYSYEATIVHLEDFSPAAEVKVCVTAWDKSKDGPQVSRVFELVTDHDGLLRLDDSQCAPALSLRMAEENLAFATTSNCWGVHRLLEGHNEGGTLVVVPGGSVSFSPVHADTGHFVKVDARLVETVAPGTFRKPFQLTLDASSADVIAAGLPTGTYSLFLSTRPDSFFRGAYVLDFEIKVGDRAELGIVHIEPWRSLAVRALDESGEVISKYHVTARQTAGLQTADLRRADRGVDRDWSTSLECTPERNILSRLTSGTWEVTVTADGFMPGVLEFSLPMSTPLEVSLVQGGEVILTTKRGLPRGDFYGFACMVPTTAPSYEEVRDCATAQVFQKFERGLDKTGVVEGDVSSRSAGNPLKAVKPGTYVLFARYSSTYYRVDDIVVTKGESTEVLVTKAPARITIVLRDRDTSVPDTEVYLVPAVYSAMSEKDYETLSSRTNARGEAVFETEHSITYTIMTAREYDWVQEGGKRGRHANRRLPYDEPRRIQPHWGDRARLEIEAFDKNHVWLNVFVSVPDGMMLSEAELSDQTVAYTDLHARTCIAPDGHFKFGPVRRSTYEFVVALIKSRTERGILLRVIELDDAPEMQVEIAPQLGTVSVTVEPPRDVDMSRVNVYLAHDNDEPWKIKAGTTKSGQPDEKGTITFDNVPFGAYRVYSWYRKTNDARFAEAVTSKAIEVSGESSVTVKFNERAGNLRVTVAEGPSSASPGMPFKFLHLQLLDSDGKQAHLGDPNDEYQYPNGSFTVLSVPEGRYTLRISGSGFVDFEHQNVSIVPGVTTALQISLELTEQGWVCFNGLSPAEVASCSPRVTMFDAEGNELKIKTGDEEDFEIQPWEKGAALRLFKLTSECRSVRIELDGFKPMTVQLNRRPNSRVRQEVTPERE